MKPDNCKERKRIRTKSFLFLFLLFFLFCSCSRCAIPFSDFRGRDIYVLTYNVCNLFDAEVNGSEYDEYNPEKGAWTEDLYALRLANTAEVIRASCPGGPDLVLLQEIENSGVIKDLAETHLKDLRYQTYTAPSVKDSPVTLAVLSRLPVKEIRLHNLELADGFSGRPVLEVFISGKDFNLYIFNNHWKSKSGGARETEDKRIAAALLVEGRIQEILSLNPKAEIILAGDLNESWEEYLLTGRAYPTALISYQLLKDKEVQPEGGLIVTTQKEFPVLLEGRPVLYSPWDTEPEGGSYWFNGRWERIDHFMLSSGLLDGEGLYFHDFSVIRPRFLLNQAGVPAAWNNSSRSGYSDHLPLLLHIKRE